MLARIKMYWIALRDSLWFIPALLTILAVVIAIGLVRFEAALDLTSFRVGHWLGGGSAAGARSVLSTIAGSLITVTGVVFSVTIVALQLASSQFTPRILRNFMADRSNQVVLGVFIATFTYTLLVLRVIRSDDSENGFVPNIAVSLAIVFALVSIGFLIHFIHHVARSIQVEVILDNITTAALAEVEQLFPETIGEAEASSLEDVHSLPEHERAILAEEFGYLQAVDSSSLFQLGEKESVVIRMAEPIGKFIVVGQPIAYVSAGGNSAGAMDDQIRSAFVLGEQRTPEQDAEFFLLEISDIAVKALSPGINDPTTAKLCLDRLTQILIAMAKRRPADPVRTASGRVHFIAIKPSFSCAVELSFRDILQFGRTIPSLLDKLMSCLKLLEQSVPTQRVESIAAFRANISSR